MFGMIQEIQKVSYQAQGIFGWQVHGLIGFFINGNIFFIDLSNVSGHLDQFDGSIFLVQN